jgi:hypothetical protein
VDRSSFTADDAAIKKARSLENQIAGALSGGPSRHIVLVASTRGERAWIVSEVARTTAARAIHATVGGGDAPFSERALGVARDALARRFAEKPGFVPSLELPNELSAIGGRALEARCVLVLHLESTGEGDLAAFDPGPGFVLVHGVLREARSAEPARLAESQPISLGTDASLESHVASPTPPGRVRSWHVGAAIGAFVLSLAGVGIVLERLREEDHRAPVDASHESNDLAERPVAVAVSPSAAALVSRTPEETFSGVRVGRRSTPRRTARPAQAREDLSEELGAAATAAERLAILDRAPHGEALGALLRLLASVPANSGRDPELRAALIARLGPFRGDPRADDTLVACIEPGNPRSDRVAALTALRGGTSPSAFALSRLRDVATREADVELRSLAQLALDGAARGGRSP